MTAYAGVAKNLETGQIYTVSEEDRRITDSSEDTSSGAKLLLNEGVKRLGFGSYQEFLLSSLWIQRRRSWWSKYPHSVCAVCDVKGKLLLHHKTYERLGCERDEDLCPLCPRCHGQVHTHAVITGGRFSTAVERYRKATTLQGKEEKIGD